MAIFRIGKSRTQCPAVMEVKTIGGRPMRDFHCALPRDHEGDHNSGLVRLDDGLGNIKDWTLTWRNNGKFWENQEKVMEPIKRKIILP